jgi:leucyl aminopeptidase (aminopeptidase T)
LENNLAVGSGERVLIVTDLPKRDIGLAFESAASRLTRDVVLVEIPVAERNGQEPPCPVAEEMTRGDVILMPVTRSLSWTEARLAATKTGARIASMPGITEQIILRTFHADYQAIQKRVRSLCNLFDRSEVLRVTTRLGTDIRMEISGRLGRGRRGGLYTEAGAWGNLPCGEAFIAPIENSAEGVYVVDASHSGIGRLSDPICFSVSEGSVNEIEGGREASKLAALLEAMKNPDVYKIAELGIGCNDRAAICGITLEDEKVLGTCHIAVGSNALFGGTTAVDIHLDGVLTRPTILFDERKIIEDGCLLSG